MVLNITHLSFTTIVSIYYSVYVSTMLLFNISIIVYSTSRSILLPILPITIQFHFETSFYHLSNTIESLETDTFRMLSSQVRLWSLESFTGIIQELAAPRTRGEYRTTVEVRGRFTRVRLSTFHSR